MEKNIQLPELGNSSASFFEGNLYIVAPVSLSSESILEPSENPTSYAEEFLSQLEKLYSYEVSQSLRTDVKRSYLCCLDVCVTDGIDSEQNRSDVFKSHAFLSSHERTGLGVLIIVLSRFSGDVSQILDTMSSESVSIVQSSKPMRLDDFIQRKYALERVGAYRSLVTSKRTICSEVLVSYMAGETYDSAVMSANITSDWISSYSSKNVAQYDSSEIYIGPKGIIRIDKRNNTQSRFPLLSSDMLLFFIFELVAYKDAALSRSNLKVLRNLSQNDAVELEDLYIFNMDFGKTIPFWNTNIFNYATAQKLAHIMNKTFGIDDKYERYSLNQEYLMSRVSLKEAISQDKQQKVLYLIALVLFFFESLPFFYFLIIDSLENEFIYRKLVSTLGSFFTSSFIFIIILRALKSKRKKRGGS